MLVLIKKPSCVHVQTIPHVHCKNYISNTIYKDKNNKDEEYMRTFVHLHITKGSRETFSLYSITKVIQLLRKSHTTIFSTTKLGQPVGRMILSYPN